MLFAFNFCKIFRQLLVLPLGSGSSILICMDVIGDVRFRVCFTVKNPIPCFLIVFLFLLVKMSSFYLFGNFAVAGMSCVSTVKKIGDYPVTTFYYLYDTTITLHNGPSIQVNLRIYSLLHNNPFPPQSIVHVYAKAYTPINNVIQLDALSLYLYPGNSNDNSYEEGVPEFPATFVSLNGFVHLQLETVPNDPHAKGFVLDVVEYVRDKACVSQLQ